MALPADVTHVRALIQNMIEVSRLLQIHSQITKPGPGRKHDVQILHKGAIVLLVACWEAYVEDLVKLSLEFMIAQSTTHEVFPVAVLERVASRNAGLNAWKLCGDGWKAALRDSLTEVLARTTGSLNTPKTAQVDELFKKALGIDSLSSHWRWKGRSVAQVTTALDDLVTLRGSIAHRVTASKSVRKKDVIEARHLISRLAARSSNQLRAFVRTQVGKHPWGHVSYLGTE
jgi:hypothetical protein